MKRILIVDDDSAITENLGILLREKYDVTIASNGFSAIEKMKGADFDLILLDLLMPGLDGTGLVHALRDRNDMTPIIIISCNTNAGEKARILKATDYLLKPFDIEVLEAKIESIIGV